MSTRGGTTILTGGEDTKITTVPTGVSKDAKPGREIILLVNTATGNGNLALDTLKFIIRKLSESLE